VPSLHRPPSSRGVELVGAAGIGQFPDAVASNLYDEPVLKASSEHLPVDLERGHAHHLSLAHVAVGEQHLDDAAIGSWLHMDIFALMRAAVNGAGVPGSGRV
jgi:hypothetical protein